MGHGHVSVDATHGGELFVAQCAEEVLLRNVSVSGQFVSVQVASVGGSVVALVAGVGFFSGVHHAVFVQLVVGSESSPADVADVALQMFESHVSVSGRVEGKLLIAIIAGEVLFILSNMFVVKVLSQTIFRLETVSQFTTINSAPKFSVDLLVFWMSDPLAIAFGLVFLAVFLGHGLATFETKVVSGRLALLFLFADHFVMRFEMLFEKTFSQELFFAVITFMRFGVISGQMFLFGSRGGESSVAHETGNDLVFLFHMSIGPMVFQGLFRSVSLFLFGTKVKVTKELSFFFSAFDLQFDSANFLHMTVI